jgi:tRNA(Ile)-lysidine synthase
MDVKLPAGKYVVAVSGGIDSVVLLDLLARNAELELIVAHFDHGIRSDSVDDKNFVKALAELYSLPFVATEGKLGQGVSEAVARQARYEFLHKVRQDSNADAIVTAHHQDDLLETAIINLIRGTARRGLSSLKSTDTVKRPLLGFSKLQIRNYALKNKLEWHEDSTNYSDDYLRNRVRHRILPRLNRGELLDLVIREGRLNQEIDELLGKLLSQTTDKMNKRWFVSFDEAVSLEIMASWLRKNHFTDYDKKMLRRLSEAAKTGRNGNKYDISGQLWLEVGRDDIKIARKG